MTVSDMVVALLGLGYQVTEPAVFTWTTKQRAALEKWIAYKHRKDIKHGWPVARPPFLERYNRNGNHS